MKRFIVLVAAVAVFVALPHAAVAQDHADHNSPKAEFHLAKALMVGTTKLEPGDYTFQCVFVDGSHFLVVTANGKELARVPCKQEQLNSKITTSDLRSLDRPDGATMTAIRIKGETIEHRLILD